jgi:hypothetical protein
MACPGEISDRSEASGSSDAGSRIAGGQPPQRNPNDHPWQGSTGDPGSGEAQLPCDRAQPVAGSGDHLHPDMGGFPLSGRGDGCISPPARGMGDGNAPPDGVGVLDALRCAISPIRNASTRRSPSGIGARRPMCGLPPDRSAIVSTMPCAKASLLLWNVSFSTGADSRPRRKPEWLFSSLSRPGTTLIVVTPAWIIVPLWSMKNCMRSTNEISSRQPFTKEG